MIPEKLKNPFILTAIFGAFVLIVGAAMPWISFSDTVIGDLASKLTADEMSTRKSAAIIIGVIGVIVSLATAASKKRYISLINVITGVFVAVMIYSQMPSGKDVQILDIDSINIGYYLALIGAAIFFIGNILSVIKFPQQK